MPRFAGPVHVPSPKGSEFRRPATRPQPLRPWEPMAQVLQRKPAARARPSLGGLPERLQAGIEALSGLAMDDVRVHRDSPEPARLGALAFTCGSDIHLGAGQDRHLPHEAWHVVQQKQGRVKPTTQLKGAAISDDGALEREADAMGARALTPAALSGREAAVAPRAEPVGHAPVTQCKWMQSLHGLLRWDTLLGGMEWYFNEKADRFHYVIVSKSAVPSEWWKVVAENERMPLTEEQFHQLGFATVDVEESEATVHSGREQLASTTKEESETRIGFEIENAWHFKVAAFEGYKSYVNKTLLTYTDGQYGEILEFLLDDAQPESGGNVIDFQGEFRTKPLARDVIGQGLKQAVVTAIRGLKPKELFTDLKKGWAPSAEYRELEGKKFRTDLIVFSMPPVFAQHVTSSINVGSYAKLSDKEQGALYPSGVGSKTTLELYQKILGAVSKESIVNATTKGRNTAKAMVKTPIEAMLAAEDAFDIADVGTILGALGKEKQASGVQISQKETHTIDPPPMTTRSIVEKGSYPSIQGEDGRGYLAIAEKLQPPLIDPANRQLRVLVEHRTDDLRDAVNFILSGKKATTEKEKKHAEIWEEFNKAAARMDELASDKD